MPATEHDHTRAHATYFGDTDLLERIGEADALLATVLRYAPTPRTPGVAPGADFGSEVYYDPKANRFFVFWTDGVANDWCQEVRDMPDAFEFLRDLTAACMREDSLFTEEEFAKWATR